MDAKFIWLNDSFKKDSYVEFISTFYSDTLEGFIDIAVDTDYELYINDKFVNCGAYHTYPNKLYFDTLKINLNKGINNLRIIAHYNGESTFLTYYKKDPVLYYKIYNINGVLEVSNSKTFSKSANGYLSHNEKAITIQLGYKVFYDFNNVNNEYHESKEINTNYELLPRPNNKCVFLEEINSQLVKVNGSSSIYDLGKEMVGYLSLSIYSKCEKDIYVSFGEHIKEGKILDHISIRDFNFNIHLKKGLNEKVFYLRRIGCRYLSLSDDSDIIINKLTLVPTEYPFVYKSINPKNEFDKELIEVAKHTIKCCYHEHFEDCPWREQSQYTFDSKCTLLGLYKVFDNPEAVNSAIMLFIEDLRIDGDLGITFPTSLDFVIPSFTLHFIPLIYDYYLETKNISVTKKAIDKFELIFSNYIQKMDNGLLLIKNDAKHWIFYEWKPGFDGNGPSLSNKDFLANAMFLHALKLANELYKDFGISFKYESFIQPLKKCIIEEFYDNERETFVFSKEHPITSELMLAYAILTDLIPEKNDYFAKKIVNAEVNESTNSFKSLVYEALLKVDQKYKDYILDEIHLIYGNMLKDGATTFYETNMGYLDFDKAGSLCHGWNAFIIKYLLEL